MSILTTTENNVDAVQFAERERCGPYDNRGRKVSRECPQCGCGKLRFEGHGIWRCDGLMDPEDDAKELEACDFTHEDGTANGALEGGL